MAVVIIDLEDNQPLLIDNQIFINFELNSVCPNINTVIIPLCTPLKFHYYRDNYGF